ncbi:MAG: hypothetical protein CMM46_13325 [Rhodospirillaceae bacterium]|nr:hypothetical protein [Rhodospirillaceae bacterium]|tara:strand:+ start:1720 stop:2055 length:336 start_codon:yes stop_codon:yes gene_type:complete
MGRVAALAVALLLGACEVPVELPMTQADKTELAFYEQRENSEDYPEVIYPTDEPFTVVYDSYVLSLLSVRTEAEELYGIDGRWTTLVARDMASRIHSATFVCYISDCSYLT